MSRNYLETNVTKSMFVEQQISDLLQNVNLLYPLFKRYECIKYVIYILLIVQYQSPLMYLYNIYICIYCMHNNIILMYLIYIIIYHNLFKYYTYDKFYKLIYYVIHNNIHTIKHGIDTHMHKYE